MVQYPNVIQLVDSDIKDHPHRAGHAYLLFPYYRVCLTSCIVFMILVKFVSPIIECHPSRYD